MRKELEDARDQIQFDLNDLEARSERYESICNKWGILSPRISGTFGVGVALEGGVAVDMGAICKVFMTVIPAMKEAKKNGLVNAGKAIRDLPSEDYLRVVQPRIEQLNVPKGARAFEIRAYNAVNAQRRVAASIRAYVDAFERYQGAESADNGQAMRRQVRAMSQAYTALGHVRHLLHDMAQPDHARNRPQPCNVRPGELAARTRRAERSRRIRDAVDGAE